MRILVALLVVFIAASGCSGPAVTDPVATAAEPRLILVTGATGTQGGAVARELLKRGFAVRALTRSPDKPAARALAGLGAEVVQGDFDDSASVAAAMKGVYGVFLLTDWWEHGVEREIEHGTSLVDSAVAANVNHVVFTSVASADKATGVPHFDSKYTIEQYLRESGLGYSIVRPVSFMNNWLWRKDKFMAGTIGEPYDPDLRHQWIAATDIGFFAGEAFAKPDEWLGRAEDIAGDEMTYSDFAKLLSDVLQRPVTYRRMNWDEYAEENNAEVMQMARWFESEGYSVDVAGLRNRYSELTTARDFLTSLSWAGETNE